LYIHGILEFILLEISGVVFEVEINCSASCEEIVFVVFLVDQHLLIAAGQSLLFILLLFDVWIFV